MRVEASRWSEIYLDPNTGEIRREMEDYDEDEPDAVERLEEDSTCEAMIVSKGAPCEKPSEWAFPNENIVLCISHYNRYSKGGAIFSSRGGCAIGVPPSEMEAVNLFDLLLEKCESRGAEARHDDKVRYALAISLVPDPLWETNLRKILPDSRWRRLRGRVLSRCRLQCSICGVSLNDGGAHAHEVWRYETRTRSGLARLEGISLLCRMCHAVEHFGRIEAKFQEGTIDQEDRDRVIEHFCRINETTADEFERHFSHARDEWFKLSKLKWHVDWGPFTSLVSGYTRGKKSSK